MTSTSQRQRGRGGVHPALDASIQKLNLANNACGIPPARAVFGSTSVLLITIKDSTADELSYIYVEVGLACANICQVLHRRLEGGSLEELGRPALDAIEDLTTTVGEIQRMVAKRGAQSSIFRLFRAKVDEEKFVVWKRHLARILQVFDTESTISPYLMVADIHQEGASSQGHWTQVKSAILTTTGSAVSRFNSVLLGESPPPPPKACLGRGDLIEEVVRFAENLEPIALIGAGGIGKTSIALTVLHHSRIKKRFSENRRFIRCDQFPASRAHFLARLSKVIGAGVGDSEELTPLRPFLSSKEMLIILDNAESILNPRGKNAQEIYSVVDELCHLKTICLLITSRITTIPRHCARLEVPTLSMGAARDIFYSVYGGSRRSNIINDLLKHIDFHALSIVLLATAASHYGWDYDQLTDEWNAQWAQVLQTDHNESLAKAIELSLASPTYRDLNPSARDLLGVVAFFPQGIDEKNLDWLFPTISDVKKIFDKLCALSLTYRSNGFVTMLAPIRDHLAPRDPQSSPLLCATRDNYFSRLSVDVDPDKPGFGEAQWIVAEDINVEHLLDISTPSDQKASDIWDTCYHFLRHLYWYKPRRTILRSKIEALADDHPSKPTCLSELSRLFGRAGNYAEQTRLLGHTLELERRSGSGPRVAQTLRYISDVNRLLGLHEGGIRQAKEALEIFRRFGDTKGQTQCLNQLAWLLFDHKQLDAAENAASCAIDLIVEQDQGFLVSQLHRVLGKISYSRSRREKAIHHFETALGIASPPNWHDELFWIHYSLAELFGNEEEFDDANVHIERAKSHAIDDPYKLGRAMVIQANVWCLQLRLEDAKSEAEHALEIYEKSGAVYDAGVCRDLLQAVERAMEIFPV